MLTVQFTARIKCKRHPRFDPAKGEAGVKGGCMGCLELLALRDFVGNAKTLLVERVERNPYIEGEVKRK